MKVRGLDLNLGLDLALDLALEVDLPLQVELWLLGEGKLNYGDLALM